MGKSYKEAGVDISLANQIVEKIKPLISKTSIPGVLGGIGGFGGLFSLAEQNYKEPVLVSGTDGVGTKLKLAFALNKHDTIGIDLVAMSVNDIITCGAKPLFFLDYISMGKLSEKVVVELIKGITEGCKMADCALLGGETAEMPGFYPEGEYDLAGFAVGIVEKNKIIDGREIKEGDLVIGLASNGLHSNGFSLVRKVLFESKKYKIEDKVSSFEEYLGEELLGPTKIYVSPVLYLLEKYKILGIAHITGGGIVENIPRILPEEVSIQVDKKSWPKPSIFTFLQKEGEICDEEMYRTFNMGIGMVLIVSQNDASKVINELKMTRYDSYIIGKVVKGNKQIIIL
ncbi:MAG: phosphoribosylformylglycinamidine cyclo-ligase [Actinobacteria bacterium RBG_13_35_12]|uniref:Phosphoribosylformylglycinamidine cyclo-ligase n=1 Tax=Candidatus Sediminicultor quintus TaxID=1797291 RepID=A0A1F5A8L1_9BACT|nr:MAG: phosphoribosylformylglycinamidine cyclo-ligase [Actinobacteria bacterium RBG_13_35_12]OGD14915.1 MAG: phosphoribosylformylglycinamidine cyclo-ligase [Candidatus Atribacteria bacterium RBG_19FT_COMBO_35_14]